MAQMAFLANEIPMTKVLVLGATGMLGSMVYDWLRRDASLEVSVTVRDVNEARSMGFGPRASLRQVDAERGETPDLDGFKWVVNCIGLIKPYIRDDNREDVRRAIEVNSLFPMRLAEAAEKSGTTVLQIATDCVYSGRDGNYDESAPHDAIDAYGKTKDMGEVQSPNVRHLRCSVIGPQLKGKDSLLNWFLTQPANAKLNGFRNHLWNGVTSLHFAKLCTGVITTGVELPQVQHVVPATDITKGDLLRIFAMEYHRLDVAVNDVDAATHVDRRLQTRNRETNRKLWVAAGYEVLPTIEHMVHEMAQYPFRRWHAES
jgi:dTDP-4-dehydrorhamnose reductase